jgi:DNA-directed RNA polymerase subunit M/transcription elongation factor TFIIS
MMALSIGITDCADCGSHVLSTADDTVVCAACRAACAASARAARAAYVAYLQSQYTGDETSDADTGL